MSEPDKLHRLKPRSLDHAKELRHDSTWPERRLWSRLRNKRLDGLKFRRQQVIGKFIVDFYCADAKLVIEVDGETHVGRGAQDEARTLELERHGLKVIRVTNDDVLKDIDAVFEFILSSARE